MIRILSINPGSTSTKFALYEEERLVVVESVRHLAEELDKCGSLYEQLDYRKQIILDFLNRTGVDLSALSAVVGRGGMLHPLLSGVYRVNERMVADLLSQRTIGHASNLGGLLALGISELVPGCEAFIADPVVVDELQDVARLSGIPSIGRKSQFHALNHKAISRKYAASIGCSYEELQLVVAHLGGGISVAAHRFGKVIDVNQGLDGYGPFSPERAGTVDAGRLVELCFEGSYSRDEIMRMLVGGGGLMAHLGTNDVQLIDKRRLEGDERAGLVLDAMCYTVGKEIGSMLAVLKGAADAVVITGGIAYSDYVISYLKDMIGPMVKVVVFPGEDEMEALAMSALRVLRGEAPLEYM